MGERKKINERERERENAKNRQGERK